MSLLVDPDYIIHSLRLAYLRRIDDHHGPRVISFPSFPSDAKGIGGTSSSGANTGSGHTNAPYASSSSHPSYAPPGPFQEFYGQDSHVSLAGLADPRIHPEIAAVHSPVLEGGSGNASDSFGLPSSPPHGEAKTRQAKIGSGLRYTQTIYGPGRSGALGMRVSGTRSSRSGSNADDKNLESVREDPRARAPDEESFSPPAPSIALQNDTASTPVDPVQAETNEKDRSAESQSGATSRSETRDLQRKPAPSRQQPHPGEEVEAPGFAEGLSPQSQPIALSGHHTTSSYTESSTESNAVPSSIGSPDYLRAGSIELPSIPSTLGPVDKSPHLAELHSSPSTAAEDFDSSNRQGPTATSSPVLTRQKQALDSATLPKVNLPDDAAASDDNSDHPGRPRPHEGSRPGRPRKLRDRSRSRLQQQEQARNDFFASLKTSAAAVATRHAAVPKTSALSALLNKQEAGTCNPFAAFYAGMAGRSGTAPSMNVEIYFPWASQEQKPSKAPLRQTSGAVSTDTKNKSMSLNVRKDATMEEVIGYGLYCFAEEGWKPDLDPGGLSEEQQETRLTTIGWTLRIVEDGEVDEDFPAIDRNLTLGKFGGDEFAIVEATAAQVKQHKEAYGAIQRRASRVVATKGSAMQKKPTAGPADASGGASAGGGAASAAAGATGAGVGAAATMGPAGGRLGVPNLNAQAGSLVSVQGTPIYASGALSRSAMGPSATSIFLRVLVTPNPEVRYKTTLQVPSDMYLADVLEMICRKRHLENVDEWALLVPDKSIVVPLDRTVESLQGNHDLALVRRSTLVGLAGGLGALSTQSSNPNASIFKRFSTEPAHPKYTKALDVTAGYKSFNVYRKTPMFVAARHERSLTLDGDWVHIMPVDMRTFQKAASFHISHVVACKVSERSPTTFKLVVWRESPKETKRYDFDAESPRQANEIVKEINALKGQTV